MESSRTALYHRHEQLGASFTDFGGWSMPLKYASEIAEHRAVRESAGVFDLSHMGQIDVKGPDAARFLNSVLVGNLAAIAVGRAKYSVLCQDDGGIIDDLISYRLADDHFLVIPNAGNANNVLAEFERIAGAFDIELHDLRPSTSILAVQGPASVAVLNRTTTDEAFEEIEGMKYYSILSQRVGGVSALVARTGYTGEDGFEIYVPNEHAEQLWGALVEAGGELGVIPAGLAARDSLRLEAGMPLYGNELSREITPFQAGIGGLVSLKKQEEFPGREALAAIRDVAAAPVLVGLRGEGRRAGRAGYDVLAEGEVIGRITSGQPSPTLGHPIALAFIDSAHSAVGTSLEVDLRGKPQPFEVVELPFYRRSEK